jgi:hypothetical protein
MSRGASSGSGTFAEPENTSYVVGQGGDGAFTDVGSIGDDTVLCNIARKFQFAVVDGAMATKTKFYEEFLSPGICRELR